MPKNKLLPGFELAPLAKNHQDFEHFLLIKKRPDHSPELWAKLSLLSLLGECDYVEIAVNKAANQIQLIPVKRPTAYSKPVRTDLVTKVGIGGAPLLVNKYGYKIGIYKMTTPLVFKYSGRS